MTKCKLFKQPTDPEYFSRLSKTAKTLDFDDEFALPYSSSLDATESSILEKFQCAYRNELNFITGPVGLLTVIRGRCEVEANTLIDVTSDSLENLEKILMEFPKEEYCCSLYSVSKILSENSIKNLKSEYYEDNGVIPLVHITPDIIDQFSDTYRVRCAMTRKDSNKFYIPLLSPNPSLLEFYYYYDDRLYLQAVEEQKKNDSILLVPLNKLEYYIKKVGYILTTREKAKKDEDVVVDKLDELFVEWIPSNRIHLELRESKSGKYALPMVDFSFTDSENKIDIYKYEVDTPSDEEIMEAYMESADAVDALRNKYTTLKKNAHTPEEFVFQYINDYTIIDFWDYQFKVLNVEVEKRWTDVYIKNSNDLQFLINRKAEEADQLSSQTNE
jgi:hypothetical protein